MLSKSKHNNQETVQIGGSKSDFRVANIGGGRIGWANDFFAAAPLAV